MCLKERGEWLISINFYLTLSTEGLLNISWMPPSFVGRVSRASPWDPSTAQCVITVSTCLIITVPGLETASLSTITATSSSSWCWCWWCRCGVSTGCTRWWPWDSVGHWCLWSRATPRSCVWCWWCRWHCSGPWCCWCHSSTRSWSWPWPPMSEQTSEDTNIFTPPNQGNMLLPSTEESLETLSHSSVVMKLPRNVDLHAVKRKKSLWFN